MIIFLFAVLIPVFVAAALAFGGAALCRAVPKLDAGWTFAGLHTLLVLLLVAPSFFGIGGGEFPFDDLYMPFFLYPGVLMYYAEGQLAHFAWPWLREHIGYHQGSYICIVLIPAVLTALFGGAFWSVIGKSLARWMPGRRAAPPRAVPPGPF